MQKHSARQFHIASIAVMFLFMGLVASNTAMAVKPVKPPPGPSLETRVVELEALVATLQSQLEANTAADTTAHHDRYTNAEADIAVGPHFSRNHDDLTNVTSEQHHIPTSTIVSGLEDAIAYYDQLLYGASRLADPKTGQDTLRFAGMNVQIVNGMGTDDGTNGMGNLIIGYNELRDESQAGGPCPSDVLTEFFCNRRTGSHMLVVGSQNNYSSYGGIVIGFKNEVANRYSAVSSGEGNTVSGELSSVSGGHGNIAQSRMTSILGGYSNTAEAVGSTISGGQGNLTIYIHGQEAQTISGGYLNTTSGRWAHVSGGTGNIASGYLSSVSGGHSNTATGAHTSISGGIYKKATTTYCTVGDDGNDC